MLPVKLPRLRGSNGEVLPRRYTDDQERRANAMYEKRYGIMLRRVRKNFRILPLDQLRGLQRVDDRSGGGGVYFLWVGPRLMYIGKSNTIGYRLTCHWRSGKRFTHATLEEFPDECARQYEAEYVHHYRPRWNKTRHG